MDSNKKDKDKKDKNYELEVSDIDKISPHYERLRKALDEVEKMNKKSPVHQASAGPTLLVSDDIERFEGVIKKVLNHREVVEKFEHELEEREKRSSSDLETEDL